MGGGPGWWAGSVDAVANNESVAIARASLVIGA
jgi:hypothetical protein